MSIQEAQPTRSISRIVLFGGIGLVVAITLIILSLNAGQAAAFAVPGGANMFVLVPAAFLAGIFSFLSPCTLPILPAYFAFTFQARRERVVLMTVAFFLGLATTMVVLGASATALSRLLFSNLNIITQIGGLIIIVFGVMSLLGKGFQGMPVLDRPAASLAGSYLYGATFALGWTACVGPILGALLTLLATQGVAILQGAVLAFIYALGLGSPLILVAAFFSRLGAGSSFWKVMRGRAFELNLGFTTIHLHSTSILSGLMLIVMGILLATGQITTLTAWSQQTPLAQWAVGLEQWLEQIFFGYGQ
jgi:cytochrome c-type biogenesis protein